MMRSRLGAQTTAWVGLPYTAGWAGFARQGYACWGVPLWRRHKRREECATLAGDDNPLDLTDRKRAEEAVRQSPELLRLVLATLPVGVAVLDKSGDIVLINAASKLIWGGMIAPGQERYARTTASWHCSGRRIAPNEWASVRALREGKTSLNELIDIETYDGRRKTIQNSAAPIRDADGLIVGSVIVNEDVTERVRAESALRESTARLQHFSRRLLAVQEEERRHLSRELHDEFGQMLP